MIYNTILVNSFKPGNCNLVNELPVPKEILIQVLSMYAVGTAKDGNPIYWQINPDWNVINARFYDEKMEKDIEGLFGGHLLNLVGSKTAIYFVSSELEAIVMSCFIPNNRGFQCLYVCLQDKKFIQNLVPFKQLFKRAAKVIILDKKLKAADLEPLNIKVIESHLKGQPLIDRCFAEGEAQTYIPDFSNIQYENSLRRFSDFINKMHELYKHSGINRLIKEMDIEDMNLTGY